ncbi:hypothetical protein PVA45_04175 [Entomospira entomophila]|uniref:Lipoprotein n=1 Tax=Entomospira entomophila TaxID=2719988 RepID=A0A968GC67_9SPIO|nr:hypothetical protein [Entomospira entomophilus]NIZ40706.1 hypothetical protein [Entomospira entomophilus]WDI34919.1 hypothetical protein PVA45_04175 [Entomospira entomophilus]
MKRGIRLALVLTSLLWLLASCESKPEAKNSGRSKEEAEAKHAELVRRQEELRRRYAAPESDQSQPETEEEHV